MFLIVFVYVEFKQPLQNFRASSALLDIGSISCLFLFPLSAPVSALEPSSASDLRRNICWASPLWACLSDQAWLLHEPLRSATLCFWWSSCSCQAMPQASTGGPPIEHHRLCSRQRPRYMASPDLIVVQTTALYIIHINRYLHNHFLVHLTYRRKSHIKSKNQNTWKPSHAQSTLLFKEQGFDLVRELVQHCLRRVSFLFLFFICFHWRHICSSFTGDKHFTLVRKT